MFAPARGKVSRLSAQIGMRWPRIRHVLGQVVHLVPRVVELPNHLAIYFKSQRVVLAFVYSLHSIYLLRRHRNQRIVARGLRCVDLGGYDLARQQRAEHASRDVRDGRTSEHRFWVQVIFCRCHCSCSVSCFAYFRHYSLSRPDA